MGTGERDMIGHACDPKQHSRCGGRRKGGERGGNRKDLVLSQHAGASTNLPIPWLVASGIFVLLTFRTVREYLCSNNKAYVNLLQQSQETDMPTHTRAHIFSRRIYYPKRLLLNIFPFSPSKFRDTMLVMDTWLELTAKRFFLLPFSSFSSLMTSALSSLYYSLHSYIFILLGNLKLYCTDHWQPQLEMYVPPQLCVLGLVTPKNPKLSISTLLGSNYHPRIFLGYLSLLPTLFWPHGDHCN